ncbi:unnamed protein product, partial [Choristocarpus tenellus]
DPSKAKLLFFIIISGWPEMGGLDAIFRNLYHIDHYFLIHLDAKQANPKARAHLKRRIGQVLANRGQGRTNIKLVEPAAPVTWGGFTMTLTAVYGIAQAILWNQEWDYFINLSGSDLPLLPTGEIAGILGEFRDTNTSFITGFKYQPAWEGFKYIDRRTMFSEDKALHRKNEGEKIWPWAIMTGNKDLLHRPLPELFTVYK